MKLYNTLHKTVEDFTPLEGNTVRMYSCGPTVYDHAHIGNLSAFIAADTLKRTLKSAGYTVQHIMNFTDVDDKTIKKSQELYPNLDPMDALKKLTQHYEAVFLEDMRAVGNTVDDITFVRATDTILEMQVLIATLVEAHFAYITDDGIYFSIDAYKKSGKTYGQLLALDSSNTSHERIDNDEYDKDSVHDFVLWKFKKDNEPYWDFHLNATNYPGRPGWHIECSAMSSMKLGQPFDIHTGGIDLIFPHHENEIAQSTAGRDEDTYANFFVHSEHLLVENKKMSKSLNNFYTLEDIKKRDYNPLAFRLLVLQSHYRKQSNFSWENLDAAAGVLKKFQNWATLRFQYFSSEKLQANYKDALDMIENHIKNDIHTPDALSILNGMTKRVDDLGIDSNAVLSHLDVIDAIFGLDLCSTEDIEDSLKQLLISRNDAKHQNNWNQADILRDRLKEQGIDIKDTPSGQVWSRI